MFSSQDIRDILQSFPLEENSKLDANGFSPLLISPQGQGFVTKDHAQREFDRIVTDADSRLLPTDIARDIDIEADAVLRFAAASPGLALLGQDRTIIPKGQVESLKQTLRTLVAQQLISKSKISREKNVSPESLEKIIQSLEHDDDLGGLSSVQGHLASNSYRLVLSEAIRNLLDKAVKEARPTELGPDTLPGSPPKWYTSQLLDTVLEAYQNGSKFHVHESADMIRCTPEASVLQQRDTLVSQLQTGSIPYLDLEGLLREFPELYPSREQLEERLGTLPDVFIQGRTAVSDTWVTRFGDACVDAIKELGTYADLTSGINDIFPSECHAILFEKLQDHILDRYPQDDVGNKLHKLGGYLVSSSRYNSDRELLSQSATTHAADHWKALKGDTQKDLKFPIAEIFNSIVPHEQPILHALSKDPSIRKSVEEAYWTEIARLEAENEAAFSKFWTERVVSRVSNYTAGLKVLSDAKLADQLSELLASYLKKELIPDSITKAISKDLLRSRKTKKQVQKLETALQKVSAADLTGTLSVMDKFRQKQGVQDFDAATLAATKQILVSDLVRRMQKQSDGPALFLLLVIVLLAKYSDGVVYATGKFAPKLMKLLKPSLPDGEYKQLDDWKNKAKSAALGKEDVEGMKRSARDAAEGGAVQDERSLE